VVYLSESSPWSVSAVSIVHVDCAFDNVSGATTAAAAAAAVAGAGAGAGTEAGA